MKKLIEHIKIWNRWRKGYHSIFEKILVLFGFKRPVSFLIAEVLCRHSIAEKVYTRVELTKDDIITDTDFDFKRWLEEYND